MMRLFTLIVLLAASLPAAELRFALHSEPKQLDPLLVADDSAEAIRYLTEGVLIRVNRLTQKPEAELASSWQVTNGGKRVVFTLRRGVKFPDGAAFTAKDVAATFQKLLDPALHSPLADTFKTDKGEVRITAQDDYTVVADFPASAGAFERLFDQVPILSATASRRPAPGLGPFVVAEHSPGSHLLLKRNPSYWKRGADGKTLPLLDGIRIEFQQNRDLELLRFRRGELQLIDSLTPDLYERLAKEGGQAIDAGPTTDVEFVWFNMAPQSPLPAYKKAWFQSQAFRRAVSEAISRTDLSRVVYRGHASLSAGYVSPANKQWFNARLAPHRYDAAAAAKRLAQAGFVLKGSVLQDAGGHAVEFSLITNAGSKTREPMAAMIQQDLAKIGIKVNIVSLDFPSLIQRITRTLDYETCLLGFVNIDIDPNGIMNILLSSAANHPWNPSQKTPATPWEAEIDKLMLAQAASSDAAARKKSFDRVQEILLEQSPAVYLLHPNSLSAVAPNVRGGKPVPFYPRTFWDAEHLTLVQGK
ncbi:ABC transporter substrate-binding protein [Paludibaculum fermentans]|uniref:ABC transporter substrate-binding protein n=1 Tax=Paludibaculum fermentans TaxID=1473598 RepID=UPI003EBB12F5